jgi:hypothetical protein
MSSGAIWPIQDSSMNAGLTKLQDPEGRWSLAALAAKDKNFQELLQIGLRMEVLYWKILVEEP